MKTATVTLKIDKIGSSILMTNVTPAELALLVAEHNSNAGGDPVVALVEEVTKVDVLDGNNRPMYDGEGPNRVAKMQDPLWANEKWTSAMELRRLRGKYHAKKVKALYDGAMPQMPTDFDEAKNIGLSQSMPESHLMDVGVKE